MPRPSLIVGLTGGIGSGKSAASRAFADLGVALVDADQLARTVVQPGSPALERIAEHFGDHLITPNGELDRPALRRIVFTDGAARQWLEALLHPLIEVELVHRLERAPGPYALLVSPLLLETRQHRLVDRVLVVDIDEEGQIARAGQRDGADPEQIRAIMAAQLPRRERLARADDILDNSGNLQALQRRVAELHRRYLTLAAPA